MPWSPPRGGLIGIDLGSSSLKLVELIRVDGGGYQIKSQAEVAMPRDTMVENEVLDSMLFSDTMAKLIAEADTESSRVAIAIGGSALFNKTIQLPYADEFDLELTIRDTAAGYIPFALDEVYLDFAILGVCEDDPDSMDVVLVACKREIVDDLQLLLMDAGLELAVVDCAVFALENAAALALSLAESGDGSSGDDLGVDDDADDDEGEATATALVNVGAHMMNVNIMLGDRSLFVRDHYFGSEQLTQLILEERNCGFVGAEQAKLRGDIPQPLYDQFVDALESELMRSIDFFSATYSDLSMGRVLLTGGGARLDGLAAALGERLSIDTELLDLSTLLRDGDGNGLVGGMSMTVAVGLALRALDND
ncbi:MAG: type IV pilus assembly protein PilM [Mariprofundales bacterium]|nr:type IV pilus assembly protein PilM [Mariprofundales bacterium]